MESTRFITTLLFLSLSVHSTYELPTYTQSNEYDLVDLKPIPKRQYFDSLGGMALGKRAAAGYAFDPYQAEYMYWRPRYGGRFLTKRQYFDSLGGMALGKRDLYFLHRPSMEGDDVRQKRQYFDSLGGMALGKRRLPPFNMFRGTALGS